MRGQSRRQEGKGGASGMSVGLHQTDGRPGARADGGPAGHPHTHHVRVPLSLFVTQ